MLFKKKGEKKKEGWMRKNKSTEKLTQIDKIKILCLKLNIDVDLTRVL